MGLFTQTHREKERESYGDTDAHTIILANKNKENTHSHTHNCFVIMIEKNHFCTNGTPFKHSSKLTSRGAFFIWFIEFNTGLDSERKIHKKLNNFTLESSVCYSVFLFNFIKKWRKNASEWKNSREIKFQENDETNIQRTNERKGATKKER